MSTVSSSQDPSSQPARGYSEKRNFIRMRLDAHVSFTTDESKEKHAGRCRNLSGTGMLLETGKKLKLGNRVNIVLPSERSELPNLEAMAEVIRVIHQPDSHTYEIGLAIQNMY